MNTHSFNETHIPMTDTHKSILKIIEGHNTMSVATVSAAGTPHCTALFYVSSGYTIYFVSKKESLHSQNIIHNSDVSLSINRDYNDWKQAYGLQIRGKCQLLDDSESAKIKKLFYKKFPSVKVLFYDNELMSKVAFYNVTPSKIRLIDNRVSFGYKSEIAPGS